jgi:AcrR family transcriptional regulator
MDPRVVRTQQQVLSCARELLAEKGAESLTFTSLAERAGVSRNTLYRHWPARESLIVDVLLREAPTPSQSVGVPGNRAALADFLHAIRDWLQSPAIAAALTSLVAHADRDSISEGALRKVADAHRRSLRVGFGDGSEAAYARLIGPVYYQSLVARQPVDDEFLDALIGQEGAENRAEHRAEDRVDQRVEC